MSGSLILTEEWGTNLVVYLYDANGAPIGMRYRTTSMAEGVFYTFWFDKNLQGDVVAVYNETGTKVLSYTYDAWGNKTTTVHSSSGTNSYAQYNAITYRGYYFDSETSLYYVSNRYYDPAIGRFINADAIDLLGANEDFVSLNLFAYCGNNPINREDGDGEWWHLVVGAAVGAITQYVSDVLSNRSEGKTFPEVMKPSSSLVDYGAAALSGALAASGAGLGVSVAANAAISGTAYLLNCGINGTQANALDLGIATGVGAISGLIGGSGADGARLRGVTSTSRQILKTAVSPKKIAMYTGKIITVAKTVVVSTVRTITAGLTGNYLNSKRKELTGSIF